MNNINKNQYGYRFRRRPYYPDCPYRDVCPYCPYRNENFNPGYPRYGYGPRYGRGYGPGYGPYCPYR